MKKIIMIVGVVLFGALFLLQGCTDSTTNSKTYKGQFGDQYVFLEIHGYFQTQGDSQQVSFLQYAVDPTLGRLVLNYPIVDPNEDFELIYGLALDFTGSMSGLLNLAGKVSDFPKTFNLADMVQTSIPLDMSITFNSISDNGDVNFTLAVSDPNSNSSADTTAVLGAEQMYQTDLMPPFTMVFQGNTIEVTASSYRAANYGFFQKQDIEFAQMSQ